METNNHNYGKNRGQTFDKENNMYTSNRDGAERVSFNTVFGDHIIGQRVPTLASQFYYPLESGRSVFVGANGGQAGYSDSQLRLTTAAQANSLSTITGTFYLRYIPGHEAYSFFTMVFDEPTSADSYQRIGIFDGNNGFYIGYSGSNFVLGRIRNGTREEIIVDTSEVFPKEYGVFNPQKGNIYKISFAYLGFGPITYEIMLPDGGWVVIGKIEYPNTHTETNVATTYLPIRAELFNGTSAAAMEMSSGSVTTGIVDGAGTDPGARRFAFNSGVKSLLAGTNTMFIFRNKANYAGKENRVNSVLTLISAATEGTKPVIWRIIKNPTITTPGTWVDIDATDSIMEYNSTGVVNSATGKDMLGWNMAKADSFFEKLNEQRITLQPGEWAGIVVSSTNATEVSLAFRWEELF